MKIKFKFINGAMLALFGNLTGGAIWVIENQRFPASFTEYPILVVITHISVALLIGALFRFIPIGDFNQAKIRSFNSLFLYKTINWDDVTLVKKVNFLFVPHLLLYTPESKWAVWVPLSITSIKQLIEVMSNSTNPVVVNTQKLTAKGVRS